MEPRKMNKALVDLIIQCRKDGLTVHETCEAAGITHATLNRWRSIGRKEKQGLCYALDNSLAAIEKAIKDRKAKHRKDIYERKVKALQARYGQHSL